jgi:hypothetical protein
VSKRSNRTRGNRPVNMGRSLRARQMKPGPVRRGGSSYQVEITPDIQEDTLIFAESGMLIGTEDNIWMAAE